MDFIIGRDATTSQLRISTADGKKTQQVGLPGSVPMNVSRKHLQLTINDDRTCVVTNLNDSNETHVNGMSVITKQINWGDRVTLGASQYLLDWNLIVPLLPKTIDITPLKRVWDEYKQREMEISNRVKNDMLLARIPMVFSMVGGLIIGVAPEARIYALPLTVVAVLLMIYGFYRQATFNQKVEQDNLKKWLQKNYTCPECGHFMGFQDYDILIQNPACPYCKTKYKK